MFTGIIADIGRVHAIAPSAAGRRVQIETHFDTAAIPDGASIACNGICLTVVATGDGWFAADASPETMACTTLGNWQAGRRINLERALKVGDELGGHMVLGHVDAVGELVSVVPEGDNRCLTIAAPADLAHLIAVKGSIAVDGISLTVNAVDDTRFTVNIVPYTWSHTVLSRLAPGDKVNLEADVLARYAARARERERA